MCTFLQKGVKDFTKFGAAVASGQFVDGLDRSLSLLVVSFSEQVVTDPHDYVYASLGILSSEK